MMYKILIGNNWQNGAPAVGQKFRFYPSSSSDCFAESVWTEDEKRNKVVVTSHVNRAVIRVGESPIVTAEMQDSEGNKLPFNGSFAMPVGRVGGSNYRTLMMDFTDGVCSKAAQWNDAGEFEITKDMINMHLEESEKLDFDGFNISVAE